MRASDSAGSLGEATRTNRRDGPSLRSWSRDIPPTTLQAVKQESRLSLQSPFELEEHGVSIACICSLDYHVIRFLAVVGVASPQFSVRPHQRLEQH